jgi:hypothetical protein
LARTSYFRYPATIPALHPHQQTPIPRPPSQRAAEPAPARSTTVDIALPERPLLAPPPHGELMGTIETVPATGRRVIFIDVGILPFIKVMAYSVASVLPMRHDPDGTSSLDLGTASPPELGKRLAATDTTREIIYRAVAGLRRHAASLRAAAGAAGSGLGQRDCPLACRGPVRSRACRRRRRRRLHCHAAGFGSGSHSAFCMSPALRG